MDVFDSVISDINTGQSFTGFVIETDESGSQFVATNNPTLRIYYDAPAVPEPLTMALFAFGAVILRFFRRKK